MKYLAVKLKLSKLKIQQGLVFNQCSDIRHARYYQSLVSTGRICLQRDFFPSGFLLVIVMHESDYLCSKSQDPAQVPALIDVDMKSVTKATAKFHLDSENLVGLELSTPSSSILRELLIPLLYISLVYVISLICLIAKHKRNSETDRDRKVKMTKKQIFRNTHKCTVQQKYCKKFNRQAAFLVSSFYIIPVVKQVMTFHRFLQASGNQDMCFSEFGCSRPYKWLSDFNHVYSNIGHILLGALALFNIRCFKCSRRQLKGFIIPPNFGLLYAMAWSMVLEGLLRAGYYVCPNRYNFYYSKF